MAITLFILIILAGYHFYMENVAIPTWRLELKNKLYDLEIGLMEILKNNPEALPKHSYYELREMIMYTRLTLPYHDLLKFQLLIIKSKNKIKTNEKSLTSYVWDSQDPQIRILFHEYLHVAKKAFLVNSGGWLLYLLPFISLKLAWNNFSTMCKSIYGQTITTVEILKMTENKIKSYQDCEKHELKTADFRKRSRKHEHAY